MTNRQILELLLKATPEQLDQTARWWGEESAGKIQSVYFLEEDFLCEVGGQECSTRSSYDPEEAKGMDIAYPKGTILFDLDFPNREEGKSRDIVNAGEHPLFGGPPGEPSK